MTGVFRRPGLALPSVTSTVVDDNRIKEVVTVMIAAIKILARLAGWTAYPSKKYAGTAIFLRKLR